MTTDIGVQHELLKTALHSTDSYLAVFDAAKRAGQATDVMLKQFTVAYNQAWQAFDSLGVLNQHEGYMKEHLKAITALSSEEDTTLADDPFAAAPSAKDTGVDEAVTMPMPTAKFLNKLRGYDKYKSGNSAEEKKIAKNVEEAVKPIKIKIKEPTPSAQDRFKQGLKKSGYDPDAAAKRITDLLAKQKKEREGLTTEEAESEENIKLTEADMDEMVNDLTWEDIVDYYDDDELVKEEHVLDEGLSAQARQKKRQAFARSKGKRGVALRMKLRRASTVATLKQRAILAARRSVYKRLLRGRDKSQLSASEKSRVEQQVSKLKNFQTALVTKMMPKIRSIEQKRLANYRSSK